jgi:hypothetical protein
MVVWTQRKRRAHAAEAAAQAAEAAQASRVASASSGSQPQAAASRGSAAASSGSQPQAAASSAAASSAAASSGCQIAWVGGYRIESPPQAAAGSAATSNVVCHERQCCRLAWVKCYLCEQWTCRHCIVRTEEGGSWYKPYVVCVCCENDEKVERDVAETTTTPSECAVRQPQAAARRAATSRSETSRPAIGCCCVRCFAGRAATSRSATTATTGVGENVVRANFEEVVRECSDDDGFMTLREVRAVLGTPSPGPGCVLGQFLI